MQNGFTTGDNRYPKTRQETLHLLDKYSKVAAPKATVSEGTSFAQLDNKAPYDKKYWKDKKCYNCGKRVIPSTTAISLRRIGREIWTTTIDPRRAPLTAYEILKRI